jgi:hypothetical protein
VQEQERPAPILAVLPVQVAGQAFPVRVGRIGKECEGKASVLARLEAGFEAMRDLVDLLLRGQEYGNGHDRSGLLRNAPPVVHARGWPGGYETAGPPVREGDPHGGGRNESGREEQEGGRSRGNVRQSPGEQGAEQHHHRRPDQCDRGEVDHGGSAPPRRWGVREPARVVQLPMQVGETLAQKEVADMGLPRTPGTLVGQGKDSLRHGELRQAGGTGRLDDDGPVPVPRPEVHAGIGLGGVAAQELLDAAQAFHRATPVGAGEHPERSDCRAGISPLARDRHLPEETLEEVQPE